MRSIATAAASGSGDLHLDPVDYDGLDLEVLGSIDLTGVLRQADAFVAREHAAQRWLQPDLGAGRGSTGGKRQLGCAPGAPAALRWPPGRAGALARFIYESSYVPVREVAIAAALGLLAGVCGRGYRTYTGKDLGLYLILIAPSGVGKDSTHDCIPLLLDLAGSALGQRFVRAQDFASGEALHKELLRGPGFLALAGEFGRKLKRMSNPTDTPMQNLRTIMTNAYGKKHLEGKSYSNSDNSLLGVQWPALSFLGETTPSTFLECLTPDMMADGFLSRFLSISYEGEKPPPNRHRNAELDPDDLAVWRDLVSHMVRFQDPINTPAASVVQPNEAAQERLEAYEEQCRLALNATPDDESERQVWSRAHLKVLKAASLLAVADHYLDPVVREEHVWWARHLVEQDIATFRSRKQTGDIGLGDDARQRKLVTVLRDYLLTVPKASYKVPNGMRENGIVPRSYLQMRTTSLPAFHNHRLGPARALDDALRNLIDNGYLMDVQKDRLADSYNYLGKGYRILRLPD